MKLTVAFRVSNLALVLSLNLQVAQTAKTFLAGNEPEPEPESPVLTFYFSQIITVGRHSLRASHLLVQNYKSRRCFDTNQLLDPKKVRKERK